MSLSEEKMKILKLLEEKKISVDEAAELLEALEETEGKEEKIARSQTFGERRFLKIKVSDSNTGKVRVNLTLPLRLARFAKTLAPAFEKMNLEKKGIDIEEIINAIDSGLTGKILEVDDEMNAQHIEIWIE